MGSMISGVSGNGVKAIVRNHSKQTNRLTVELNCPMSSARRDDGYKDVLPGALVQMTHFELSAPRSCTPPEAYDDYPKPSSKTEPS